MTEFSCGHIPWPSPALIPPTSGPSSYGSGYELSTKPETDQPLQLPSSRSLDDDAISLNVKKSSPTVRRMPSRRRSLSSLSIHSERTARSIPRIKVGSSKVPDTLARKLLFRRRRGHSDSHSDDGQSDGSHDLRPFHTTDKAQANCLMPWRGDVKSRKGGASTMVPFSTLRLDLGLNMDRAHGGHKVKTRSYSSPLPLSSVDTITSVRGDIFMPLPVITHNHFDEMPRELRLEVMSSLLVLHEAEYERYKAEGKWTVLKASSSKGKWVGMDRGIRELLKFSRVSGIWRVKHILSF